MAWVPSFKLYQSNGSTLLYTLPNVIAISTPSDNPSFVEIDNLRSQGSIVIPGGDKAYDITIQGVIEASDYESLESLKYTMRDTIANNTRYVLKIDKTQSTTEDIKVMRLQSIIWDRTNTRTYQYYTLILKAKCWS